MNSVLKWCIVLAIIYFSGEIGRGHPLDSPFRMTLSGISLVLVILVLVLGRKKK